MLRFKGAVSYRELPETCIASTATSRSSSSRSTCRSTGSWSLGQAERRYTFFAIYLAVELPAGIPALGTGLALYGMAGLFALEMEPDKRRRRGVVRNRRRQRLVPHATDRGHRP